MQHRKGFRFGPCAQPYVTELTQGLLPIVDLIRVERPTPFGGTEPVVADSDLKPIGHILRANLKLRCNIIKRLAGRAGTHPTGPNKVSILHTGIFNVGHQVPATQCRQINFIIFIQIRNFWFLEQCSVLRTHV
ncbi:hypothetical protein D3C78_375100 [compost metagenome]